MTDRRRDKAVEVKIGVRHRAREIVLESGQTPEEVERAVFEALAGRSLSLVDDHGRKVLVPADRLAYVGARRAHAAQGGIQRAVVQASERGPVTLSPGLHHARNRILRARRAGPVPLVSPPRMEHGNIRGGLRSAPRG